MLRRPSACAPKSIDSRPITVVSRVVRCGMVSIPQARSIAAEAMSALIPARAPALSFRSTKPTRPESFSARDLDQAHHVGAERRVELRGDDPLPGPQRLLELRLALLFAERDDQPAPLDVEPRPRRR